MAAIQDHAYVKLCAQLASELGISLASARRQVDQMAAREGTRDNERRRNLAATLLEEAKRDGDAARQRLNALLRHADERCATPHKNQAH